MTLLKLWQVVPGLKFSVHLSKCVVKYPPSEEHGKNPTNSLLVPTNPTLTSTTLFPYFQRVGSPVTKIQQQPQAAASSRWGGMDAGSGMVYPVQTVDGQVYSAGGQEYWSALANLRQDNKTGMSLSQGDNSDLPEFVTCSAVGHLKTVGYDNIIHVASPGYIERDSSGTMLRNCYMRGFLAAGFCGEASHESGSHNLVSPLVGAGCRGWPVGLAADGVVGSILDLANKLGVDVEDVCDRTVSLVLVDKEVVDVVLDVASRVLDR